MAAPFENCPKDFVMRQQLTIISRANRRSITGSQTDQGTLMHDFIANRRDFPLMCTLAIWLATPCHIITNGRPDTRLIWYERDLFDPWAKIFVRVISDVRIVTSIKYGLIKKLITRLRTKRRDEFIKPS